MRRVRSVILASTLALFASAAHAQDWDVGPGPSRPHPTRPRPTRPRPTRPAPTGSSPAVVPANPVAATNPAAAQNERRARLIAHLTEALLRNPEDASATLPALLRLVRERDGQIDALVTDLEARARSAGPTEPAAHLVLGQVYREAGRLDEAIVELERAERAAPDSPFAARALGELYRRMDRVAQAREATERALSHTTDPHAQAEVLRALMDLSLAGNDVPGARAFHQRLVALDRASVSARREFAEALLARRLFAEAVTELQSLARSLVGDNRVLPPVLRDLGSAQMQAGDHPGAIETLRRALSLAGSDSGVRREIYSLLRDVHERMNDLDAWVAELDRQPASSFEQAMLVADIHDHLGHEAQAVRAYRRAITLRPTDVDAHVSLVRLLSRMSQVDELLLVRRRLVQIAPRNPTYVVELARELLQHGQRAEALRMLAAASARAGADPEGHQQLANVYSELGEAALSLHEAELVARFDQSPEVLGALADRYLTNQQRDRALATARRMIEGVRESERPRAMGRLAEWYGDHDMVPMGIETYREALRLRADEVDLHKGLAVLLERQRSYGDAANEWRRVIELATRDRDLRREARARIINLWHVQGQLATQVPFLERAFDATPPDLEAGRDLAEAYARLRRPEESERVLRRVAELDRGDATALVALERVLAQRGDLSGAIEVLRRLLLADPSHARDWYQRMARHALALHRDAEAIESAAHAVQLNPDDAQGHLRLGELYQARNDTDHAVASYRRAIELNDRLFATYFQLADLYLARGQSREAVELFRRVVRLSPDDELVGRAGRMAIQIAPAGGVVAELERDLSAASVGAPTRAVLRRLLVDLYASICRPLINELRHGAPAARVESRAELTRIGARALKPLLDALADGDTTQHTVSLEILGYLGNPNATSALITVAEGDGSPDLRRGALRAAAALADPRALPRLAAMLNSGDTTLAVLAAWGVARIHTAATVPVLVRAMDPSRPPNVRAMAALGLAGVRDPRARAALLGGIDPAQDEVVRACAVWSLGGLGDPSLGPRIRANITGSVLVRSAALIALSSSVRDDSVVPEIAAALFSPQGPSLRRAAARALIARARGPSALGAVDPTAVRIFAEPSSAHTNDGVRGLLAAMLDPPAEPMEGVDALTAYTPQIAQAARAALMLQESAAVVLTALQAHDGLLPLVSHAEASRREEVLRARQEVLRAVVVPLAAMVRHPLAATRARAIRALADVASVEGTQALIEAARDPSAEVAEGAIRALGQQPTEDAAVVEVITARMASGGSWTLRVACAEALGAIRVPAAAVGLLAALAGDDYAYVRAAAARGLAHHTRDAGVRAGLERAARDDVELAVRSEAQAALGN